MIKYLGSKRRLVPVLEDLARRAGARTALDLFTGTTRVAQAFKRAGAEVTAADATRFAHVFAQCYVATDATAVDHAELAAALDHLRNLPGRDGYVTEVFCRRARYLQPHNGMRIDAIRDEIAAHWAGSPLEPILLTSLVEAADRVDSTTGVQMAYVKAWSQRSHRDLDLRVPELVAGPGHAVRGDAARLAAGLGEFDLAYLDPPYNQHRYDSNYHVWETLVAWDRPEHYGVACKRVECREPSSVFNRKREMPVALAATIAAVRARVVVVSASNEAWISLDELVDACRVHGAVEVLSFDQRRYVGAQIGIHGPDGSRVGRVSHLRNTEHVLIAGPRAEVRRLAAPHGAARVA